MLSVNGCDPDADVVGLDVLQRQWLEQQALHASGQPSSLPVAIKGSGHHRSQSQSGAATPLGSSPSTPADAVLDLHASGALDDMTSFKMLCCASIMRHIRAWTESQGTTCLVQGHACLSAGNGTITMHIPIILHNRMGIMP